MKGIESILKRDFLAGPIATNSKGIKQLAATGCLAKKEKTRKAADEAGTLEEQVGSDDDAYDYTNSTDRKILLDAMS